MTNISVGDKVTLCGFPTTAVVEYVDKQKDVVIVHVQYWHGGELYEKQWPLSKVTKLRRTNGISCAISHG